MSTRLTLSLDAMGGDSAPQMVVEGVDIALARLPQVDFLLFGDEGRLAPLLDRFPRVKGVSQVRHTDSVVSNHEKPYTVSTQGRRVLTLRKEGRCLHRNTKLETAKRERFHEIYTSA